MSKLNPSISVDFTEQDLRDLQEGQEFDWTFPTNDGQQIDIHLFKERDEDEE